MSRSLDDGNEHAVRARGDAAAPQGVELAASLGRGRLGDTWLARTATGAAVAAKRLRTAVGTEEVAALRRLCEVREPELLGVLDVELHDGRVWMLAELCDGVTLRRLLAVAALSPAQWVTVARSVLAGLAALHRRGLIHGALHAGNVHVSGDGRVRLGDGGVAVPMPAVTDLETLQTGELAAAWTLLRAAATAAGRRTGWPRALDDLLTGARPVPDAPGALRALTEAAAHLGDPAVTERSRTQLAALVVPLRRRAVPAPTAPPLPASVATGAAAWVSAPPPRRRVVAAPAQRAARRRRRVRRLVIAGFACALVGAVTVVATAHLTRRPPPGAAGGPVTQRHTPSTATAPPAPAHPALPDLPILGPPAAGEVAAVSVEPLSTGCVPGASCTVTVRVDLSAHPLEMVGWVLEIIDRCSGRRTEIEVRPMAAPPSFVYVYRPTTLLVPATSASAIVALTTAPAHAASTPLLIPGGPANCVE